MLKIESPVFSEGDAVPGRFTCEGDNVSPPLSWSGVPEDAEQLRISVRDPDAPAGTFTHWLAWGIAPLAVQDRVIGALTVSFASTEQLDGDGRQFFETIARQAAQPLARVQSDALQVRARNVSRRADHFDDPTQPNQSAEIQLVNCAASWDEMSRSI